jgi:hypothetical protein
LRVWHMAVGGPLGFLVLEFGLRAILFSPSIVFPLLKVPGLYADADASDDYWVLYHYYSKARFRTPEYVDPTLGWVQGGASALGAISDKYLSETDVKDRPLLFFGDSFIAGATTLHERIPQLLEKQLPGFSVLNYGVGGYGTDQITLRFKRETQRWKDRNPVVLVGILLKDMDRSLLTFRISQKPYYRIEGGTLRLYYPRYRTNAEFIAKYRFHTKLFAYAALVSLGRHALGLEGGDPWRREELNRRIIADACDFIAKNRLEAYFVILYDKPELLEALQGTTTRREYEIKAALSAAGYENVIDTKELLLEPLREKRLKVDDVFLEDGHYNAEGNRIVAGGLAAHLRATHKG